MDLIYVYHVKKRMKERGIEEWEVEHVINYPSYIMKSFEGRMVAVGELKNRKLKVIYSREENYIKVISVMFL